jgi:hypothetical protein
LIIPPTGLFLLVTPPHGVLDTRVGFRPRPRRRFSSVVWIPWRRLFIFLSRNSQRASSFFHIPAEQVIEIGVVVEI